MKDRPVILQNLQKTDSSPILKAKRYYSVMLALNGIHLPELELNLLSFIAVRGTISSGGAKEQFCEMFKSTKASIANTVLKLTRKGLLVKINNRTKVVDSLQLNFNNDILLKIKLLEDDS